MISPKVLCYFWILYLDNVGAALSDTEPLGHKQVCCKDKLENVSTQWLDFWLKYLRCTICLNKIIFLRKTLKLISRHWSKRKQNSRLLWRTGLRCRRRKHKPRCQMFPRSNVKKCSSSLFTLCSKYFAKRKQRMLTFHQWSFKHNKVPSPKMSEFPEGSSEHPGAANIWWCVEQWFQGPSRKEEGPEMHIHFCSLL